MRKTMLGLIVGAVAICGTPALAAEHSIGQPVIVDGMIVRPVYLQPVHMAPMLPGMNGPKFDAHLEADIHADKGNKQGFNPGSWIPYLTVSYLIVKEGSDWSNFGTMTAMVANDGPHYGINVKFNGPGKYRISLKIMPPPYNGFFRHTDKETGVAEWWAPIEKSWSFVYTGTGHKGGY
ncbi:MAG: iron transporter [Pseudolabrys sp.]